MKKSSNAVKFSPGTKIKASDDDYIIKQGKDDVISLKTYTGEKFTFKTFTDAFNKVAELQKRTDEGLRKAKVIFPNGNTMTFDLAKAEKDTAEFERIKALDNNLGKAPAKKAIKPTTGFIIEEYSIGEKWHLSGTDEKGEPTVYATREEAETQKDNKIKEWADEGMDFDTDDFRVISVEEYETKVKAVMKEYGLGPKAAREFLYSGQRLGKPGNKAATKEPGKKIHVAIEQVTMLEYGHTQSMETVETAWVNKEGVAFDTVEAAAKYIVGEKANDYSEAIFKVGGYYMTEPNPTTTKNYWTYLNLHVKGATPAQEKQIHDIVFKMGKSKAGGKKTTSKKTGFTITKIFFLDAKKLKKGKYDVLDTAIFTGDSEGIKKAVEHLRSWGVFTYERGFFITENDDYDLENYPGSLTGFEVKGATDLVINKIKDGIAQTIVKNKQAKNRAANINKNIMPAMDALDDAKIPMTNHGFGMFHVEDKHLENARAALKKAGIPFREIDMTLQGQYKPKHYIIIEMNPVAARNKAEARAITVGFIKERTSIDYANHWKAFDETKGGYTEADPSKPETWAKIDTVLPITMNTDDFANMLGKVHGGTWKLVYKDETDDPDMIVSFERKRAANKAEKVLICSFCGGKLGEIERDEKNDVTWRTCLKCGYEWNKAHWQWLEEKEKNKKNKAEAGALTIGSGDYTVKQLKDGFRVNMPAGGSMTFNTLSEALVFIYRDRAYTSKIGKITVFMADGTTKVFDTNKTKKNRAPSKNPKIQAFYNEKVAPAKDRQDKLFDPRSMKFKNLKTKHKLKANKLWIDVMVPLELGILDEGVEKAIVKYEAYIKQLESGKTD